MNIPSRVAKFYRSHRALITRLTIPLLILSAASFYIFRPISIEQIILGLASDFLVIVITVWYVDYVLRQHEASRWHEAEEYVSAEAGKIAHSFITEITDHLGLDDDVFPSNDPPLHRRTLRDVQVEILENVSRLEARDLIRKLNMLDAPKWAELMNALRATSADISDLLSQFSGRIGPTQTAALLRLRQEASTAQTSYSLFKGFLGVPISQLPTVKGGKEYEYVIIQTIQSGNELKTILDRSLEVIAEFSYQASGPDIDMEKAREDWDQWWQDVWG